MADESVIRLAMVAEMFHQTNIYIQTVAHAFRTTCTSHCKTVDTTLSE